MSEIITKIDAAVKKYNMLTVGDSVVVGVSGGADSMLLLKYLISKREALSLRLIVANVEHGIRGEESKRDSAFVEQFCKENGVEFHMLSIDAVKEADEAGLGVEEYSRNKRYAFFSSFSADKIATAHNLSDSIETVLFRLSRGTSIKGCAGIPPVRGNIIRPLIECSGSEIRAACKEMQLAFVVDSTNADNSYSRNYVRNVIIPDFEKLNPSFETAFMRFISNAAEADSALEQSACKCFDASFKNNTLLVEKLKKFDSAVIKKTIIKFLSLYDISVDEIHLSGVYALLFKQGRFQIRKNIFAISDKKRLRIAVFEQTIDFDDIVVRKKITSRKDFLNNCELFRKQFDFFCDYDKIVGGFTVRGRDSGDEISPAGRGCTKSLKKIYNEYKIPVEDRENIPVICDDKGVIGIYGYCCDERVKIDNNTTSVVLLNIRTED